MCFKPGGKGAEGHLPRHPRRPRQAPHPLQVEMGLPEYILSDLRWFLGRLF